MRYRFHITLGLSVAAVALLVYLMYDKPTSTRGGRLVLSCAAGIRQPVEDVMVEYGWAYDVSFQTKYKGSGELLGSIPLDQPDLFLAADREYLLKARQTGLVREILPLALQYPVILVAKDNPRGIRRLDDLLAKDVKLSLAKPEIAAISKVLQTGLKGTVNWETLWQRRAFERHTVEDVGNDVKLGAVHAGIVWNATAIQYPQLQAIEVPELSALKGEICIGIVSSCKQPAKALQFARYLAARDKGLVHFAKRGYAVAAGDAWSEHLVITLHAGGLNRLAIEKTVEAFKQREGVQVSTTYSGCGTLVGQMKAGTRPDVYFACERSFMDLVRRPNGLDLFLDPVDVSETNVVIVTPKGNPKNIQRLADLAHQGVRLALCNSQKSALGVVTDRLLAKHGLLEQVRANVLQTSDTADLCVQQVVVSGMDAAIVYQANVTLQRDKLEVFPIDDPLATAVQPIAVGRSTKFPQLSQRLVEAILSAESEPEFTKHGFRWLGQASGHR